MVLARTELGTDDRAVLVANPLPPDQQLDPALHDRVLAEGLAAESAGVAGQRGDPVPARLPGPRDRWRSLEANVRLVIRNARLAGADRGRAVEVSRVVVLGDVMVDVVTRLSVPLASGSDAPAVIRFHGGGSAANTAAWLAEAGAEPVLVGRVGDDERGRAARDELRAAGVDAVLAADPELPTGTCVVLVGPMASARWRRTPERTTHSRTPTSRTSCSPPLQHLHVAGYALLRLGRRPAASAAISRALKGEMSVSVDPSSAACSPGVPRPRRGCRPAAPNADEAQMLTGERDAERAAHALAGRFGEVVVTLGAEGALWTDGRRASARKRCPWRPRWTAPAPGTPSQPACSAARLESSARGGLAAGAKLAAQAVARPGGRPQGGALRWRPGAEAPLAFTAAVKGWLFGGFRQLVRLGRTK